MTRSVDPELVERARGLAGSGRLLLGLTGAPGSGKSTLAAALARAIGGVCVPMDGFHLANEQLVRLGRADRKGAPDTFDAQAYVMLLERLRADTEPAVRAPRFRREIEASEPDAIEIPRGRPVVTEGNYLLLDQAPWDRVAPLLDEVWFLDLDDRERESRLVARHVAHGRTQDEAIAWVARTDRRNAQVVVATRDRAHRVVRADAGAFRFG